MSATSAQTAVRALSADALKLAVTSPSTFARAHAIEVADAIPLISREARLRKSHKIWRK